MNPKMAIRKLVPKVQTLEIRVDGGGQQHGFTAMDVAAATIGTSMGFVRLLQAQLTGDPGNYNKLFEWLDETCRGIARRRRYKIRGADNWLVFDKIVQVVYMGIVSPGNCHACVGRGWILRGHSWDQCEVCNGAGKLRAQATEIRRLTGITRSQWDAKWRRVHDGLTRELKGGMRKALEDMGERLSDE